MSFVLVDSFPKIFFDIWCDCPVVSLSNRNLEGCASYANVRPHGDIWTGHQSLTLQNVINMYQVLPPPKKSKPLAFQPSFWFFTWLWKTDFVDLLHILRVILRRKRSQRSQRQNGKVRDGASITPVCLAAHGKSVGRPIAGPNMQTHQAVDQIWRVVFQQITVTEMCLESITGIKYHAVIYQC